MKSTLVEQPETPSPSEGRSSEAKDDPALRGNSSRRGATRTSSVILFGTSFKTSPLAFREGLISRLDRDSAKLPKVLAVREYAQLVTCNRIEILVSTHSLWRSEQAFMRWLSKTPGLKPGFVYSHKGVDAIGHIFRVAAGLDSMVLGEEQILSQVKEAGIAARTAKSSRGSLSALFDASVGVGKRVRAGLRQPNVSVSSMALSFALGRLPEEPRNVLLIGTGKTTRLAASQLRNSKLYFVTRRASFPSFSNAVLVTQRDLRRVASKCELIVSATKHDGYLLKKGDLDSKGHVILDLAFPRNVDPDLNSGSTQVYNLDDLAKVFESNPREGHDARLAEELVREEAESFARWLLASRQSSMLGQVYRWAENVRKEEAGAALRRLPNLSERQKIVVEAMSKRLVSKLLSPPTAFAKSSSPELPQDQRLDLVKRIFDQRRE